MSWDNRKLDINGTTEQLPAALKFAFAQDGVTYATAWVVVEVRFQPEGKSHGNTFDSKEFDGWWLVILPYVPSWSASFSGLPETPSRFLAGMTAESILPSINGWLMETWLDPKRAPIEPDHDGSNGQGWRMVIGPWGKFGDLPAIFAIRPEWLWYGK